MARQRRFTAGLLTPFHIFRQFLNNANVRNNTLGLNRPARRCIIPCCGQPHRTLGAEWDNGLHRPLAERPGSKNCGASVILERTGNDFRCGGGTAIDQNNNRLAINQIPATGGKALAVLIVAATGRYNFTAFQKRIGNGNRLIQKTAGIIAQIQDIAFQFIFGQSFLYFRYGIFQTIIGLIGELGQPDVSDTVFQTEADGADFDDIAYDGDIEWRAIAAAYRDRQRLFDCAPHLFDSLIERQSLNLLAIQVRDQVAGLNPGLGSRRIVNRRHDLDEAVFHCDFNSKAAKFTASLNPHILESFRIHET